MWKRKGTPFNPLDGFPHDHIAGKPGTGKSVVLEIMKCEEAIRNGAFDEEQAEIIMKAIAFGYGLGCGDTEHVNQSVAKEAAMEALPDFLVSLNDQA